MRTIFTFRNFHLPILFAVAFLFSSTITAQTWTFRNGFGQSGATNNQTDLGRAVCTDALGNVYMTGKFSDDQTANTVSFGGTALVSSGRDDGFVVKFDANGNHIWSIRFGGTTSTDIGYGIATDGTSVFVTGTAFGTMTVGTNLGTTYPAASAGQDGVVMKLDAISGAVNWVTRFGGANSDEGQAICTDGAGNVYISGIFRTQTANPSAIFGAFTRTVQGNVGAYTSDLFVAKLNSGGTFQWVSTGGIAGGNDNIGGSGICYVPTLSKVVVVGSFRWAASGTTTATYGSVTLTNSSATVNEDFCLLEVDGAAGTFTNGSSAGAGDGNEAGLGITYDSNTGDVFFTGSFSSTSVTFPGLSANSNAASTFDNVLYGRYNPTTHAYIWVRDADNSTPGTATDVGRAITSNGGGGVIITGRFTNTLTFPSSPSNLSLTASSIQSDIFVARINVATGNAEYVTQGSGTSTTVADIGYGIASSSNGNVWLTGQYGSSVTFSPLTALASNSNREDIVLAKFVDRPNITTQPSPSTACAGLAVSFSVVATGAPTLTYSWQEATNSTFTTGLVTLSNTGVYSGTGTATLSISDNTGLGGRYYRAVVSNSAGSTNSNGALLTVSTPTLSTGNTVVQTVGTNSNTYYTGSCVLVAKIVPSGASPITGSVTTQVWVEPTVPRYRNEAFVQRHYQITPAVNQATATATVTLYFTQAEFTNFNAAAGTPLDLPTGTGDNAGKARLRVGKYPGTSNDGSGLPGSYTATEVVMDPPDANIVFNATFNRWEVTFDVVGFSGFVIQTNPITLPVNLLSFTALLAGDDVKLKWQTGGEIENDHFEVERSIDGKSFTAIGQRAGNNGNRLSEYELADIGAGLLGAGKLFYRLKIVSLSGKVEYSKTIIVSPNQKEIFVTGILPNPFVKEISIGVNAPRSGKMKISVVDMTGRVLLNRNILVTKGFSTQPVDRLEQLTSGVYTLVIDFEGSISTYKIVK